MAKHHPISARTHGSSQQGLSLLDLVAGIAVAFVLCFLAFPSQQQLLSRYRTLAHAQELTQLLLYARGEAIRRGSRIPAPPLSPSSGACRQTRSPLRIGGRTAARHGRA